MEFVYAILIKLSTLQRQDILLVINLKFITYKKLHENMHYKCMSINYIYFVGKII